MHGLYESWNFQTKKFYRFSISLVYFSLSKVEFCAFRQYLFFYEAYTDMSQRKFLEQQALLIHFCLAKIFLTKSI